MHLTRPTLVVALLAAVLFINYIDRGAVATSAPLIQHDLGLTHEQLGRMFSAFFWTYAIIQIPVGWLAERYGAHRVLVSGLVIWSSATALIGASASFAILLLLRMMLGIGESVGFPCVAKLVASVVPIEKLGAANGIVALGYLIGPGVGTWAAGLLIDDVGWRGTFFVFGAASLLWLLPWSRVKLPKLATAPADATTPTWGMVLRQRGLWGTVFGLFSSNYVFYFIILWLPDFLVKEHGFSMHQMERISTLGFLVNGASALLVGWGIDRYVARRGSANFAYKSIMVLAHTGFFVSMLLMASHERALAIVGMFAFQILMGASSPGTYAMPQILAGPRASGRWVGIQNSLGNFPGIISPWVTGLIVDRTGHFTLAFILAAAVALLGILGWVGLVPRLEPIQWPAAATATE